VIDCLQLFNQSLHCKIPNSYPCSITCIHILPPKKYLVNGKKIVIKKFRLLLLEEKMKNTDNNLISGSS
ncbi:hypothetical protein, partial [Blautia wexlerae]|uniref:hypothetical protein n=1 Tax=Blautia wexlerae TaxID=418240 RepID=UPI0034A0F69C